MTPFPGDIPTTARDEIRGRIETLHKRAGWFDNAAAELEDEARKNRDQAAGCRALAEDYQSLVGGPSIKITSNTASGPFA